MGGYSYITDEGDMWDFIAWKVYGDESYTPTLLEARENLDILDTYIFSTGVSVWCPYVEDDDAEEIPEWDDDDEAEDDSEEDGNDWRDNG